MSAPREPDERGANGQKTCDGWAFRSIKDNGCPLFAIEPTVNNVGDLAEIVKRMAAFRKTHAQEKREEEARRTAPLKAKPANKSAIGTIDEMPSYVQSGHVKWGARVKQPGLEGAQQHRPRSRGAHGEPP